MCHPNLLTKKSTKDALKMRRSCFLFEEAKHHLVSFFESIFTNQFSPNACEFVSMLSVWLVWPGFGNAMEECQDPKFKLGHWVVSIFL